MRAALFDEFKEIEWRARVEAIREKLDQQRDLRQEQEKREEADREAEEEAEEEVAEQASVFAIRLEKWPQICSGKGTGCSQGSNANRTCSSSEMWWNSRAQGCTGIPATSRLPH